LRRLVAREDKANGVGNGGRQKPGRADGSQGYEKDAVEKALDLFGRSLEG
jgi:hypothetical protein